MWSCPDSRDKARASGAESFGDLVGGVIKNLTGKERLGAEEIGSAWEAAAGNAAKHSRPVSFKRDSLVVNVESSSWLYELTVNKKEIIKILEKNLKGKKVRELRFRIGDIKEYK